MNSNELEQTAQDPKSRTETGQRLELSGDTPKPPRLPKDHENYWASKLRQRRYKTKSGNIEQIPELQVRLIHANREGWFNLGTKNKSEAGKKARDIYLCLRANGWEKTLEKFKPKSEAASKSNLSVGDYLSAVQATGRLNGRTFLNYQNCLRTIIAESFGVRGGVAKYDYRAGGSQQWAERIDCIRLSRVTPDRVSKWKEKRLKLAGKSPAAIASAKRTVTTYLRCARSLFSAKVPRDGKTSLLQDVRKQLRTAELPSPLPFDGVSLFGLGNQEYHSKIDVHAMIAAARNELKPSDPETYKVFLLALFAGMRKAEIDSAEWGFISWNNGTIALDNTEFLHLKTDHSRGEITLDPEPLAELRELMPLGKGRFIIDSTVAWRVGVKTVTRTRKPRDDSPRAYYRCGPVFERLNVWLRSKGVTANKPLHELRKEIGSLIAKERGIYDASAFLRHADISTTARHYADRRGRISIGLGKLLDTDIKAIAASGSRP